MWPYDAIYGFRRDFHNDGAFEWRQERRWDDEALVFPWQIAVEVAVVKRNSLFVKDFRLDAFDEFIPPCGRFVTAPDGGNRLAAQSVHSQMPRFRVEWPEIFRDGIQSVDRLGEAGELPPKIVAVDILMIPMPELATTC